MMQENGTHKAKKLDALSYKCGVCGIRKESQSQQGQHQRQHQHRRRGSFSSTSSNDSFTIDDLVHNLEGIEVNIQTQQGGGGGEP